MDRLEVFSLTKVLAKRPVHGCAMISLMVCWNKWTFCFARCTCFPSHAFMNMVCAGTVSQRKIATWKSVLVYLDWQWTVQISSVVINSVVQCKVINSFLNNFLAWNVTCHHSLLNSVIKLQALVYDSLWRKVPESDAWSVLSHVLWYDLKCQPYVQMKNKI